MMSNPMLLPVTQWFEGTPPYMGAWEVPSDSYGKRYFAYYDAWNGWSVRFDTPEKAYKHRTLRGYYLPDIYRGLAEAAKP